MDRGPEPAEGRSEAMTDSITETSTTLAGHYSTSVLVEDP